MAANRFRVPKRQWRKWSDAARIVFNEVFAQMTGNQELFLHPAAPILSNQHWRTTAWNSAWIAASATNEASD